MMKLSADSYRVGIDQEKEISDYLWLILAGLRNTSKFVLGFELWIRTFLGTDFTISIRWENDNFILPFVMNGVHGWCPMVRFNIFRLQFAILFFFFLCKRKFSMTFSSALKFSLRFSNYYLLRFHLITFPTFNEVFWFSPFL